MKQTLNPSLNPSRVDFAEITSLAFDTVIQLQATMIQRAMKLSER